MAQQKEDRLMPQRLYAVVCLVVLVLVGLWIGGPPPVRRALRWAFSASEQRQAELKEGIDLFKAGSWFKGAMKIAASQGLHWILAGGCIYAIVMSDTIALLGARILRLVGILSGGR
jgi:hypothetical protein